MARCFGENVLGECSILYVDRCDKKNCAFFKSKDKFEEDANKASQRCKKLGIPSGKDYIIWKTAQEKLDAQADLDYKIWKAKHKGE